MVHQDDGRATGEETGRLEPVTPAVRQLQLMREREFGLHRLEVGGQLGHFTVESQIRLFVAQPQPPAVAPSGQPLEQLNSDEQELIAIEFPGAIDLRQPLDELPVLMREEFLLVSRARGQFDDFGQTPALFAGSRTGQHEFDSQSAQIRLGVQGTHVALDAQPGAGRVQVHRRRRQQPVFQLLDQFLFLLGLLELFKPLEVGVRRQFGWERAPGAHEQQCRLFQPRLALRGHQPWPPVVAGEILA